MLTLEDCMGLCELTQDEIDAIARHEHIPDLAAALLGSYLCRTPAGELCIKDMIRDDIARSRSCGDDERELALKLVLRDFVIQHPRCDERHRFEMRHPERRLAGPR
jgi:hypothetical protein